MSASTTALIDDYFVSRALRTEALARSVYDLEQKMTSSNYVHRAFPIKRAVQTKYSYGSSGRHPSGNYVPAATQRSRTFVSTGMKPLGPPPQLPKLAAWCKVSETPDHQKPSEN